MALSFTILELLLSSCLSLPSAVITGPCHSAQLVSYSPPPSLSLSFICFFQTGFVMEPWLSWGWPWTQVYPPASASQLKLKVCATTFSDFTFDRKINKWHESEKFCSWHYRLILPDHPITNKMFKQSFKSWKGTRIYASGDQHSRRWCSRQT